MNRLLDIGFGSAVAEDYIAGFITSRPNAGPKWLGANLRMINHVKSSGKLLNLSPLNRTIRSVVVMKNGYLLFSPFTKHEIKRRVVRDWDEQTWQERLQGF